jgi:hypothetical protein
MGGAYPGPAPGALLGRRAHAGAPVDQAISRASIRRSHRSSDRRSSIRRSHRSSDRRSSICDQSVSGCRVAAVSPLLDASTAASASPSSALLAVGLEPRAHALHAVVDREPTAGRPGRLRPRARPPARRRRVRHGQVRHGVPQARAQAHSATTPASGSLRGRVRPGQLRAQAAPQLRPSCGSTRLIATCLRNPWSPVLSARNTSAMPPDSSFSMTR